MREQMTPDVAAQRTRSQADRLVPPPFRAQVLVAGQFDGV
jgi:hypothetical protein